MILIKEKLVTQFLFLLPSLKPTSRQHYTFSNGQDRRGLSERINHPRNTEEEEKKTLLWESHIVCLLRKTLTFNTR